MHIYDKWFVSFIIRTTTGLSGPDDFQVVFFVVLSKMEPKEVRLTAKPNFFKENDTKFLIYVKKEQMVKE